MGKKLAIKSHSTRGKEVIELLEMMGGVNWMGSLGNTVNRIYYIYESKSISYDDISLKLIDEYEIFTLEEFWEKYPYKVGDKVQVLKSGKVFTIGNMIWDDEVCNIYYYNTDDIEYYNAEELKLYKETDTVKPVTDKSERTHEDVIFDSVIWHLRNSVNNGKQYLSGGDCEAYFRELVKKVKVNDMESCKCPEYEDIKKVAYLSINDKDYADEIEVNLGDDYEYKFEMNRLYILKKKLKYPKTYEECCYKTNFKGGFKEMLLSDDEYSLSISFIKLKRCRDAYWKIAGEQMGLDKPWEPTIQDTIWGITRSKDEVEKYSCHYGKTNLLEFPTAEMRDALFKNFKDLIEQCKELL